MIGYWIRHRLLLTFILCGATAGIIGLLFVFPCIRQQANNYNSQSIYKNTDIDFIVPEPSYEQVDELVGNYGIDKVFPYYMTKTQMRVNGIEMPRTTTILLSDQWQNIDFTMYNDKRLIKKSDVEYNNPILVDWQFCYDTGANIGDTVSFTIDKDIATYRIYAIYETNSIYGDGAVLAYMSDDQKESIKKKSKNNGYSGMYISARNYSACRSFLTTDYRPLGRLNSREQYEKAEQYQIHYNAILSSDYANEITDFRIKENELEKKENSIMIWLGSIMSVMLIIGFNFVLLKRGCEKVYFTQNGIPQGQNVMLYYYISFFVELVLFCLVYAGVLIVKIRFSDEYIPRTVYDANLAVIPSAVIIAEVINLIINHSVFTKITGETVVKSGEKYRDPFH